MAKIEKETINVLSVLVGNRTFNRDDFWAFSSNFLIYYNLRNYNPLLWDCIFYDYLKEEVHNFKKTIKSVQKEIKNTTDYPLAIFVILIRPTAEETKELPDLMKYIKNLKKNIYIYPIIWDRYTKSISDPKKRNKQKEHYLYISEQAVHISFGGGAPSAGARRICEFIQRILGYDLPDKFFPDYSWETIRKMANHINQESFNAFNPPLWAIPKYPIRNGRPHFPILEVEITCPKCGKVIKVHRNEVDKNGGAKLECWYPCQTTTYFPNIKDKFDSWPEYDEYRQKKGLIE